MRPLRSEAQVASTQFAPPRKSIFPTSTPLLRKIAYGIAFDFPLLRAAVGPLRLVAELQHSSFDVSELPRGFVQDFLARPQDSGGKVLVQVSLMA
jgi:hypothetical protein